MSSSTPEKKLTEEERRQIDLQRRDFFKGTIAIIVIYGVFILGMSVLAIVSETSKMALFVNGFPFTVTFMAGTIFIIILLLIQIFSYGSTPPPTVFAGENMSCPDYWVLKETPQSELGKITDPQARLLSKYYCEHPTDTLNTDLTVPAVSATEEKAMTKLRHVNDTYKANSISQNYHMQCNRLYPDYMAYLDKKEFPDNPTAIRCKYLSQCKNAATVATGGQGTNVRTIPWTSVCPNPE